MKSGSTRRIQTAHRLGVVVATMARWRFRVKRSTRAQTLCEASLLIGDLRFEIRRHTATFLVATACALLPRIGLASCETSIAKLRFDDEISCFKYLETSENPIREIKFIDLGHNKKTYLSLGGEIRGRYEYTGNPSFGADQEDRRGVWLQRMTLHADLHISPNLRLFTQAFHALEVGRAGGPSPVDENRFELQNAFAEVTILRDENPLKARAGRQELEFGSGRLVSVRDGPNNRRNFDGARLLVELPEWRIDAFATRPVAQAPGAFDDETSSQQRLWGLYATGGANMLPTGAMDLYYLGFSDDNGSFAQGTAQEERHSIGLRLFGAAGGWDWNGEAVYQFGSFGESDIRAWTIASETGYTFSTLRWRPRVSLSLNIASGDEDPDDRDLGTFNPLYPRGNYFSEAAVFGPRNFFNVDPGIMVSPLPDLTVEASSNFFWRLSTQDGVYTPSGQILRDPGGSDKRFVGTGLSLSASYKIAANLEATAIYSRVIAGEFLRETGHDDTIDYFEFTLQWKF